MVHHEEAETVAMSRQKWSVNALAAELGIDRRTIARKLSDHGIAPAGNGSTGSPVYWFADAIRVLRPDGAGGETVVRGECSDIGIWSLLTTLHEDHEDALVATLAAERTSKACRNALRVAWLRAVMATLEVAHDERKTRAWSKLPTATIDRMFEAYLDRGSIKAIAEVAEEQA